jgi:hypothetical protein
MGVRPVDSGLHGWRLADIKCPEATLIRILA